jgi:hypothetical protein
MTRGHRNTIWAFTSVIRLTWGTVGAGRRLGQAGGRLENWVDGIAACRGIDVLDVLAPLPKRRSGAEEV